MGLQLGATVLTQGLPAGWLTQVESAALAAARAVPLVLLVPAFGLRALPLPLRLAMALCLTLAAVPSLVLLPPTTEPWLLRFVRECLLGLPVAVGVASLLWAASVAGDLVATVRADFEPQPFAGVAGSASNLGVLFSLLATLAFFELGGPARVVGALAQPDLGVPLALSQPWWQQVVHTAAHSIDLALAIAAPLMVAFLTVQLGLALVVRAGVPVNLSPVLPGLRALGLLLVFGLLFHSLAGALVEHVALGLPFVPRP